MQKRLILEKIDNGYYKFSKDSDYLLYPLYLFICYGPFLDSYVEFLEDSSRTEFYGNVANLQKNADKVTIEIV